MACKSIIPAALRKATVRYARLICRRYKSTNCGAATAITMFIWICRRMVAFYILMPAEMALAVVFTGWIYNSLVRRYPRYRATIFAINGAATWPLQRMAARWQISRVSASFSSATAVAS